MRAVRHASQLERRVDHVYPVASVADSIVNVELDHVLVAGAPPVCEVLGGISAPLAVAIHALERRAAVRAGVARRAPRTLIAAVVLRGKGQVVVPFQRINLPLALQGEGCLCPGADSFIRHQIEAGLLQYSPVEKLHLLPDRFGYFSWVGSNLVLLVECLALHFPHHPPAGHRPYGLLIVCFHIRVVGCHFLRLLVSAGRPGPVEGEVLV